MAGEQTAVGAAPTPPADSFDREHLLRFLSELRVAGFAVGVGECIRACEAAQFAHEIAPDNTDTLRNYLAPIVAGTPDQQAEFYARFNEWQNQDVIRERTPPPPLRERSAHKEFEQARRRNHLWALGAMLSVLVITTIVALNRPDPTPDVPPDPQPSGADTPAPAADKDPSPQTPALIEGQTDILETTNLRILDAVGQPVSGGMLELAYDAPSLPGHADAIHHLSMDARGKQMLTASYDGSVILRNLNTGVVQAVLPGHTGLIMVAFFSPDGEQVLTASDGSGVKLWAASGELVLTRATPASVMSAAYSPDGLRVVLGLADGSVQLWEPGSSDPPVVLTSHSDEVRHVLFSPDGQRVLSASADATAYVSSVLDQRVEAELDLAGEIVSSVAFDRDSTMLATFAGSRSDSPSTSTATIWDAELGTALLAYEFDGIVDSARSLEFSDSGDSILILYDDGTAQILSAQGLPEFLTDFEALDPLDPSAREVFVAAFWDPPSERLTSVSENGNVRLWDTFMGAPLALLAKGNKKVGKVAINQDRDVLAVSYFDEPTTTIVELKEELTLAAILRSDAAVVGADFGADDRRALIWDAEGVVRIWDPLALPTVQRTFRHDDLVLGATFDREQTRVLSWSSDSTARLWDAIRPADEVGLSQSPAQQQQQQQASVPAQRSGPAALLTIAHRTIVGGALFNADESQILSWSNDGNVQLTDVATGATVFSVQPSKSPGSYAEFNPNGRSILYVAEDEQLWLLDAATGDDLQRRMLHGDQVRWARFDDEGARILAWTRDGSVVLWRTSNGEAIANISHRDDALPKGGVANSSSDAAAFEVRGAVFNQAQSRVLSFGASGVVRLWNAATGADVVPSMQHDSAVVDALFNTDETRILSLTDDGTAFLWDAGTGQQVLELRRNSYDETITSVLFSSDESQIIAAALDGGLTIWDAQSGAPISATQAHESSVTALLAARDGSRVLTASEDGSARLWWTGGTLGAGPTDDLGQVSIPAPAVPRALNVGASAHIVPAADAPNALTLLELSPSEPFFTWWRNNLRMLQAYVTLGILGLFLTWLWLRWRRRKVILQMRQPRVGQSSRRVHIAQPPVELYGGRQLLQTAMQARERQSVGVGDMDIDATVKATISNLGYPTPVYRQRMEMPVYVALIDRRSAGDQAAQRVHKLLDRLERTGVIIERYTFDGDPRMCRPFGGGRARKLQELAAVFHDGRVLVFSEGNGLLHPLTGRVRDFVAQFDAWPQRALMTPVAADHWGGRELELAASGFMVLPGSLRGFGVFASASAGVDDVEVNDPWRPPFPPLLLGNAPRWLAHDQPIATDVDTLCTQLRTYLGGRGFRWLCALAVYPELNWHLTLYLGIQLKQADDSMLLEETLLIDLTRLPWLRHGIMPDWLRLRLIHELTEKDEGVVRDLLRNLLEQQLEERGSFALELAGTSNDRDRDWRNVLRGFFNSEPESSALPDQVFVGFLFGKPATSLQLEAPDGWRRFVFSRGIASLGLRPLFATTLALLGLIVSTLALELIALRDAPDARTSALWVTGGPHDMPDDTVERTWLTESAPSSVLTDFAKQPLVASAVRTSMSTNGRYLLSTQSGRFARLWNVNSKALIATIEAQDEALIRSFSFDESGEFVRTVTGNNRSANAVTQTWVINPQPQVEPEQQVAPEEQVAQSSEPTSAPLPEQTTASREVLSETFSTDRLFESGDSTLTKRGQRELSKWFKRYAGQVVSVAVVVYAQSPDSLVPIPSIGGAARVDTAQARTRAQAITDYIGEELEIAPMMRSAVGSEGDPRAEITMSIRTPAATSGVRR